MLGISDMCIKMPTVGDDQQRSMGSGLGNPLPMGDGHNRIVGATDYEDRTPHALDLFIAQTFGSNACETQPEDGQIGQRADRVSTGVQTAAQ